jgi:hypothetical protein
MLRKSDIELLAVFKPILCALAIVAATAAPLAALAAPQEEPIIITAQSSKQEMHIGDTLTCTISVEWQQGIEVKKVEPSAALGVFEIQNVQESPTRKIGKGRFRKVSTFTLSTFDTGDFEIPPFRIHYTTADGQEKQSDSQPLRVSVKGIINTSDQRTDVRDIKPPLSIPPDTRLRNMLIAAAVALILIGIGAWLYIRKRILARRRAGAEEWIPPKPIEELAYDDLAALEASDLLAKGHLKQYYTRLSEIIRIYLGRRYRFAALDMTSFEILHKLGDLTSDEPLLQLIDECFEECDLVKFAKYTPPEEFCRRAITRGRQIVELTTPKPVAEENHLAASGAKESSATVSSSEHEEK